MVCERWCVKDGVCKMVVDRWCVTKLCVTGGRRRRRRRRLGIQNQKQEPHTKLWGTN